MKKTASILLIGFSLLTGSDFLDDDMDGVENQYDKCPNSLLTDIVDANGCVVQKITYPAELHGDVSIGYGYTKLDDNNSQTSLSLSLGIYYGNFSSYFYTSNYEMDTSESGVDDSTVEFSYRFYNKDFVYTIASGLYLPTYDASGNDTDYFIRLSSSYYMKNADFSFSFQHTFMNDDFTNDTERLSVSAGYSFNDKIYSSITYTTQDSIYNDEKDLDSLSVYTNYSLSEEFFLSISASKGLSSTASDYGMYINLGYMF